MKPKTNWNERLVLMVYNLAMIVEGVVYICSLGYICLHFGAKVLFSDWAMDFTERGESK